MLKRIVVSTLLLTCTFFSPGVASAALPAEQVKSLQKTVLALDSAWNRALKDLQQKKRDSSLQDEAKQDYAKFITYLSTRITDYCRQIRTEAGDQAVTGLPCPEESVFHSAEDASPALSKTEQVAALDKSLTEALGEFDQQLLQEEQRLATRRPAEREYGGGLAGAGGTANGQQTGSGRYGGGSAASSGAHPGTGEQTGNSSSGSSAQTGSQGSGPYDSGNSQSGQGTQTSAGGAGTGAGQPGSQHQQTGQQEIEAGYDDIVARQLREAAEKETDPELQKKLWEEYRKYKEGIR